MRKGCSRTAAPHLVSKVTLEKHFLSCVNNTAFPEPGLHTRAISLKQDGYRSQFFFFEPILPDDMETEFGMQKP